MIDQNLRFQVSRELVAQAEGIASERFNKNSRRRPASDLGSPQANMSADFWGILGELVYERIIREHFEDVVFAPKIADKPCPGADVVIGSVRLDIKSIRPNSHSAKVNERKLQKQLSDGFLFVEFFSKYECVIYLPIATAKVRKWHLQDKPLPNRLAVDPYRVASVRTLTAVTNIEQFVSALTRAQYKLAQGHFSTPNPSVAQASAI